MNKQLWNVWHHGKSKLMNENQTMCWHYIMDIHKSDEVWYSQLKL